MADIGKMRVLIIFNFMQVFTPYITLKNGRRLYASSYGLKVFRFEANERKTDCENDKKKVVEKKEKKD